MAAGRRSAPVAAAFALALASSACSPGGRGAAGPPPPSGPARYVAAAFGEAAAEGERCGLDYRTGLGRMLDHLTAQGADTAEAARARAAFERERAATARLRRGACDRDALRDALYRAQDQYNRAAAELGARAEP